METLELMLNLVQIVFYSAVIVYIAGRWNDR